MQCIDVNVNFSTDQSIDLNELHAQSISSVPARHRDPSAANGKNGHGRAAAPATDPALLALQAAEVERAVVRIHGVSWWKIGRISSGYSWLSNGYILL